MGAPRHPQEVRDRAISLLGQHGSFRKAASAAGVPVSTMHRWVSSFTPKDIHDLVRTAKSSATDGEPYVADTADLQAENAQQEKEQGSAEEASLEPDTGAAYAAAATAQPQVGEQDLPPQISWVEGLDDPLYLQAFRRYVGGLANGGHSMRAMRAAQGVHPEFDLSPEEQQAIRAGVQRIAASEDFDRFRMELADPVPPRYLRDLVAEASMNKVVLGDLADRLFTVMREGYVAGINLQLLQMGLDPIAAVTDPDVLEMIEGLAEDLAQGIGSTWNRDAASQAGQAWVEAQSVTVPQGDNSGQGGWAGAVGRAREASAQAAIRAWVEGRSKMKSDQWAADAAAIGLSTASHDFQHHNGLAETGTIEPAEAVCDHCADMIEMGKLPAATLLADPPPYHSRCDHWIRWDLPASLESTEGLWTAQAETPEALAMAEVILAGRIELAWSRSAESAGGLARAAAHAHHGAAAAQPPHGWVPTDDWLQGQKAWAQQGEAAWRADRQHWPAHPPALQWVTSPSDKDTRFAEGAQGSQFRITKGPEGHEVHAHISGRSFRHPGNFAKLTDAKVAAHTVHARLHRESLEGRAPAAPPAEAPKVAEERTLPKHDANPHLDPRFADEDQMFKSLPWENPPNPAPGHFDWAGTGYTAINIASTRFGDAVEWAVQHYLGANNEHPGGRQGALDVRFDSHLIEIKGVTRASREYKASPKRHEIEEKQAYIDKHGLDGYTMVAPYDYMTREIYFYSKPGIGAPKLTGPQNGWKFHGKFPLDVGSIPWPADDPNGVQWAGPPEDLASHLAAMHGQAADAGIPSAGLTSFHQYLHRFGKYPGFVEHEHAAGELTPTHTVISPTTGEARTVAGPGPIAPSKPQRRRVAAAEPEDFGVPPIVAAGLAVLAADTGRVLMLQRHADDPNHGGRWEFPGGTLEVEDGETPFDAAKREWQEEIGRKLPAGEVTGGWVSPNGIYEGFVWQIAHESEIPVTDGRRPIENPDDPDGDNAEVCAWWEPADLPGMSALRPEVNGTDWSQLKPS